MKVKRVVALSLVGVLALALTGCLAMTGQTNQQQDVIGPLRLTTTLCTRSGPGCGSFDAGNEQLLLAYQVPTGLIAPATVTVTTDSGPLTLSPDPDYTSERQTNAPPPAGFRWVGYRSTLFDASGSPPAARTLTANADFTLRPAADGGPFVGPVDYKVSLGERSPNPGDENGPTRCPAAPVSAAQRRRVRNAYARGGVRAARRALPRGLVGPTSDSVCGEQTDNGSAATNDLAVLPGGGATGQQGTTVDVPFNVKFAGAASDDATFALSVSGVPGASVASPFKPASDSTTAVAPSVAIPDDLAPGTYDVTLTATKGGQTRSGVTQLTVTPKAAPLPPLTETLDELPQTTLGQIQSSGQPATVGCNVDCTAIVDLLMYKPPADRVGISAAARWRAVPTVLLGRLKVPVAGGAKQTVTIPVRDNAKDKLGNLGRFTLVVRTTASDGRGQATPALVRKVRLKPGCGGRPSCVPRR